MNTPSSHVKDVHCELPPIEVAPGLFLRDAIQTESKAEVPTIANFLIPPLTCWSIMSLDYQRVYMDVQLLHEVYLNSKKKIKVDVRQYPSQEMENMYWSLLRQDIELIRASHLAGRRAKCSQRLVILLDEIKVMVKDVMGPSKMDLDQYYDDELLVAEIETGQFVVEGYARLIHSVLGLNSPLTLSSWELLQDLIDPDILTNMTMFLKHILTVLEAIKTERMFHQLSVLRPTMQENLVLLERQFWTGRMGDDLTHTKNWLLTNKLTCEDELVKLRRNNHTFYIFTKAISNLIVADRAPLLPECLLLDDENVERQRESARLLILDALSLGILQHLTGKMCVSEARIDTFKEALFFVFKRNTFTAKKLAEEAEFIIVKLTEAVHQKSMTDLKRSMTRKMCRDILTDPKNSLRQVITNRLRDHLIDLLWRRAGAGLVGFNGVQMELEALSASFTPMAFLNWNVHQDRYEKICSE